ncbi:MAG: hypothetical protein Kow0089_22560 [Desulfobulbaceae bacterium]
MGIMARKTPLLVATSVLLLGLLLCGGCTTSSKQLTFVEGNKTFVIDKEGTGVSIYSDTRELTEHLGPPAAGEEPLPPPHVRGLIQSIIQLLVFEKGALRGIVWEDVDGNGLIDTGETGVPGIKVFVDNDSSGDLSAADHTATTDVDGNFTIAGLDQGTKTVYLDGSTLPPGYGLTTTHPRVVAVTDGQTTTGVDFGIQDQSAEIRGTVLDQTDGLPMAGIHIYLDQNSDYEYTIGEPHATTDGSGAYLIAGLPAGTYNFIVDDLTISPTYYLPPDAGTTHTPVTLSPGESRTIDLAYFHKATISGAIQNDDGSPWAFVRVFLDLNNNGLLDAGEPVTVTDAQGNYTFDGLPPGTYTVVAYFPSGYSMIASPGPVEVNEGDAYSGADFLARPLPASISGTIWDDRNGNGYKEPGENGLDAITVFLDQNGNGSPDGGEPVVITDATGNFAFTGLPQGTYTIRVDDAPLLVASVMTTKANPVAKTIEPGQNYEGCRFGYQRKMEPVHTLLYPTRLAWGSDGSLYVSDNKTGSVFIYDGGLTLTGELKGLARPLAVLPDASGNMYVSSSVKKNIEVYNPNGNLLRTIGDGDLSLPTDLAFDRDGNLYVLDSEADTVLVYDPGDNLVRVIGDSLLFDYAVSLAIQYRDDGTGTEIGELYVADQPNCTIHVFTLDGAYQRSMGARGSLYTSNWDGKFAGLVGVAIGPAGYVHGLDNSLNVVQVFEPQTGAFVTSYNAYLPENETILNLQTDIAIHPVDNRVIISNVATRTIELVNTLP